MNFGRNPRLYKSTVAAIARDSVRYALIKPVLDRAVKAHVHGLEHLDDLRAPFLVTPNHSGHFDGPLIMLTMPSRLTKELATGAAADYFFTKWYTAMGTQLLMNAFPVDRARNKGRNHRGMSGELLDAGVSLLIFPEGTRSRTGGMGRFKPGTAALAIAHNVPVVPVALVGSWAAHREALAARPPRRARRLRGPDDRRAGRDRPRVLRAGAPQDHRDARRCGEGLRHAHPGRDDALGGDRAGPQVGRGEALRPPRTAGIAARSSA